MAYRGTSTWHWPKQPGPNPQWCCRTGWRIPTVRLGPCGPELLWCSSGSAGLFWPVIGSSGIRRCRRRRWSRRCRWFGILGRTGAWCGCRACLGSRKSHTDRRPRGPSRIVEPPPGVSLARLCSRWLSRALWILCHSRLQHQTVKFVKHCFFFLQWVCQTMRWRTKSRGLVACFTNEYITQLTVNSSKKELNLQWMRFFFWVKYSKWVKNLKCDIWLIFFAFDRRSPKMKPEQMCVGPVIFSDANLTTVGHVSTKFLFILFF